MKTYLACMGTRPEIIKMSAIHRILKERGEKIYVFHTGQHEEVAYSLYDFFNMGPDFQLQLTREIPTLSGLTAELLEGVDKTIAKVKPDVILVQGDTSSALAGALGGYYHNVPVAHIEAGLRTGQRDPFPEEKNRELIGRLARWHFPPTKQAKDNLLREGLAEKTIHQVGNTVIDSALWVHKQTEQQSSPKLLPEDVRHFMEGNRATRLLLVTAHRRENWGAPIKLIATAVGTLLKLYKDLSVVWPLHPNPSVRKDVLDTFKTLDPACRDRLCLTEPLEYPALITLLSKCFFTLTDSGGIQEEASALSRPVLILREETERQELVSAGGALLVGTDVRSIVEHASVLLNHERSYKAMQIPVCPFGDGKSASRIADILTGQY